MSAGLRLLAQTSSARWAAGVALGFWFAAAPCIGADGGSGQAILHQVKETADDGEFLVTPRTKEVDANARLTVSFQTASPELGAEPPSQRWVVVTNMLAQLEKAMAERAALWQAIGNVQLGDPAAVKAQNDAISAFNRQASDQVDLWEISLGLGSAAFKDITSGRFDGQIARGQPYRNLSRWLKREIEQMRTDAKKLVDANTVEVTVQAFHMPLGGTANRVHVDNYDNIPAGDLQPLDRTGLRLTPAEQRRLAMEVEMAETARDAIREIQEKGGEFPKAMNGVLSQIRERFTALEEELSKGLAQWPAAAEGSPVFKSLQTLAQDANTSEATRKAAAGITNALTLFKKDFELAASTLQVVRLLKASIPTGETSGLGQVLFGAQGVLQQLSGFQNSVEAFTRAVGQWGERLKSIQDNLGILGDDLSAERKLARLPEELKKAIEGIQDRFPATAKLIADAGDLMRQTVREDQMIGADTLGQTDFSSIWHDVSNLDPGILDLQTVGLAPKDRISVKVGYREKGATNATMKTFEDGDYNVVARLMGFHREFGASVMFARGLRNGEEEWKPNVAAHVHWFYRYRKESGAWRKSWNFVNPGLGFHLASLDQGDDSVEIGMGVNASFFDGVVVGGVGFNLTNDQHPYAFVGLSLLDLLESAKKLKR